MMKSLAIACVLFASASGCTGTARGLEAYRTDTAALLATGNGPLQSCYDEALKADATAAGTVTVKFVVQKKTGSIADATVDATKSTAPKPVGDCVLKTMTGLKLDPPDRNEGRATFVYDFKPPAVPAS